MPTLYRCVTKLGGVSNTASLWYATVSGGFSNTASSFGSVIGGGYLNTASGAGATVGQTGLPFRIDHDEKFNQTTHLQ